MDDEAVPILANGPEDPVVVLGSGILGHTSFERHTDRYGAVHLTVDDSIPGEPAPARTVPVPGNDLAARIMRDLAEARQDAAVAAAARQAIARTPASRVVAFDHTPLGAAGTLVAHVIHSSATDRDREFGKRHPELRPPETGERAVLGSGILFTEKYGEAPVIGVRPGDGRETEWMDPNAIFRCKNHLVRLEFEPKKDRAPATGTARVQAVRQEGDLPQSVVRTAQAGFPVTNPLAQPGQAASDSAASDDALPQERQDKAEQVSGRAGGSLSGAPWDQSDARTPQALAAANFPRGPAGSLRPGSGIEDSSSQSANSARPGRAGAGHPGRTR